MNAKDVIENVTDDSIWDNAVWVNKKEKVFFVPIWRCGNTSFMFLAKDYDFELVKDFDVSDYTGFALVRSPTKRIIGQLYRAYENNNSDNIIPEIHLQDSWLPKDYKDTSSIVEYANMLLEEAKKGNWIDMHMIPQHIFLENYNCAYLIDLDNIKIVGHTFIDEVMEDFSNRKIQINDLDKNRQQVEDRFVGIANSKILTEENIETVKDIYQKDYELYGTV
jgi:hypothetical protein